MIPRFQDFLKQLRGTGRDAERARVAAILLLNRALANAPDRRAMLALLLDEAIQLFGAERGFVVLGSSAAQAWQVAAARSLDREPVRQPERKLSSSILKACLEGGTGVFCADAREGDFGASQSVADLRLRSVLCAPLAAGDATLGCLYLDHRFQSGVFTAGDVPWLQAFADQAAIALRLQQLLEDNQSCARQLAEQSRQLEARAAERARELDRLPAPLRRDQLQHDYPEIVGTSPALVRSLQLLERVMSSSHSVLLVGESGTGKELMARALHRHGDRASGPLVAVNVAAIHPGLLESELFGHVRGAFTGAERDRVGLLREADRGVLFLDEITEMERDLQAKLLRFLEERVVRPLGGDAGFAVDLRVVAATNREPLRAVAEGLLREDLYYRLAGVTIELPPLRERLGDVPALAEHYLAEAAAARGEAAKRLTPECIAALQRRAWPGNVRQLRNELLRLEALCEGQSIGVEHLGPAETGAEARGADLHLARLERWAIRAALERAGGNKASAARILGISRRALYNKLRRP